MNSGRTAFCARKAAFSRRSIVRCSSSGAWSGAGTSDSSASIISPF
jgi:hypothetical protein